MEALPPYMLKYIDLGDHTSFAGLEENHGEIGCAKCHGGDPEAANSNDAHASDFLADPSANPVSGCGNSECHPGIATSFAGSMHLNIWGERQQLADRAGYADFASCPADIQTEFNAECTSCHATCGDCHISRPNSVHGGLVDNHRFLATPDKENNCEACHGSRVGVDFEGSIAGVRRDVHNSAWQGETNSCTYICHSGDEMHADGSMRSGRYDRSAETPACTQCHLQSSPPSDPANIYHQYHWPAEILEGNSDVADNRRLDCYVCHSQEYNNCDACHVSGVWTQDEEYHERNPYTTFKIGNNVNNAENDKGKYVVVRHIPVARDTYAPWGLPELGAYDEIPNWKYTSPHNSQQWTRQTAGSVDGPDEEPDVMTCFVYCHLQDMFTGEFLPQNRELYLTQTDLADPHYVDDPSANMEVIVDGVVPDNWIE